MPQHHITPEPSNIQPVAPRRVRAEDLDEKQVEELIDTYWDERADDISPHDSNGIA